jgi:acyl-CoA dehydrogenase family protein 9
MREPSFVKSLFFGVIEESAIFPWPEPATAEVTKLHSVLDNVRRFFDQHINSAEIDRTRRIEPEVLAGLKELGCFGMRTPEADGGVGLSNTGSARVMQEIAGLDASVAMTLAAHQSIGMKGLLLFGTDAQKKRYLAPLARGEIVAAFALAEASAGSDAAAIRTKAQRQPDGSYILDGSKVWTTNGGLADVFTVFARTSPTDDSAKPKLTAFFVERGPGVTSGANDEKLGVRGASTTTVHFDHVAVPAENVIGEPGRGFNVAMQVLDSGRLDLASGCVGLCRRVIKMAVERCRERRAFGRPIGEFGLIKDKIATMISETWALECVTYLTTGMVDAGADDFSVESAICKVFGSETCWRVVNESLQVAAGIGYMAGDPYERLLRDARVNLVFEGTNEILRAFIALSGMQGPGRRRADVARAMREPIKGFGLLREFAIRKARGALGPGRMSRNHPFLDREAAIFETYVHELSRGVDNVLRKHGRDIAEMQYTQKRTADIAIDLYAIAASIARATRVVERRGEEGARREIDLTRIFVGSAEQRLRQTLVAIDKNDDELRKTVATRAYADGAYPFDIT